MSAQLLQFIRGNALFIAVLIGLVGAFVLFRTKGTDIASVEEFDTLITGDQPTVVEFYSNT